MITLRLIDRLRDRIHLHAAYIRVFDTPDGKLVLRHIMEQGFVLKTTFVAGDPHETSLNEGSRRLALSILKFANQDHNKLINQIEEATHE
jgi:hypothetical protein